MENESKRCWIDVETSGIDPEKNCILTMGVLIDIGGQVKEELSLCMKPFKDAKISGKAMEVNGLDMAQINSWPSQMDGYLQLRDVLGVYVDRFNRLDKMVFCAYNANFDDGFCRKLFTRCHDTYYGSYFYWPKMDVQTLLAIAISNGLRLSKYNLATVCEHYGIEIDAHDALSDIKATRTLYEKMRGEICQ